jgi:hypothetical protein
MENHHYGGLCSSVFIIIKLPILLKDREESNATLPPHLIAIRRNVKKKNANS